MRIGVIGAGHLGAALGGQLCRRGHEVMLGGLGSAYDTAERVGVRAGSNSTAVMFSELVVLAVPFHAIESALSEAGPLGGRVLWTCVNASKRDLTGLAVGFATSAAEEVARRARDARVVAAIPPFAAAIAAGNLCYEAELEPSVFVCGEDVTGKAVVADLITELGAHAVDAGPLEAARLIEPAMMLATSIAFAAVPRDVSLRLLERPASGRGCDWR